MMFGRMPPAALSKDLLGRMMACRLQEQAFSSLDRESLRFLDGLARHGGSPRRQLKPGTVLVRDYHGQRHTVTVAADGFEWQGTTYPSLSAIARAITGTAWSGPRFFALARGNGTPPAHGRNKKWARAGRNGPATGSNKALLPLVVDAIDPRGNPVKLPVRNDETNETETVSRFAVRVPAQTFDAVRSDKLRNGIVQNSRLAQKRRGLLEPEFLMPVLEGRLTHW